MSFQKQIENSTTIVTKAIFPNTTNHYDTLFGGQAMEWMDEVAFITATRFSRQKMVTVSSDQINFKKSIPAGTIIEMTGKVTHVGRTSLKVSVEMFLEQMDKEGKESAINGAFTFVAIDNDRNSVPLIID